MREDVKIKGSMANKEGETTRKRRRERESQRDSEILYGRIIKTGQVMDNPQEVNMSSFSECCGGKGGGGSGEGERDRERKT